jgi:hypothetical protein
MESEEASKGTKNNLNSSMFQPKKFSSGRATNFESENADSNDIPARCSTKTEPNLPLNPCWKKIKDISENDLKKKATNLAGLLDGEGTYTIIHHPKSKPSFYPSIQLGMTHEATVKKVAKLLGVDKRCVKSKDPNHKDCFVLKVNTQYECMQICRALYGQAVTKKEPIKCVMEFLKLKRLPLPSMGAKRKEILSKMADLFIACRKANHRGKPVDFDVMRKHIQELIDEEP